MKKYTKEEVIEAVKKHLTKQRQEALSAFDYMIIAEVRKALK